MYTTSCPFNNVQMKTYYINKNVRNNIKPQCPISSKGKRPIRKILIPLTDSKGMRINKYLSIKDGGTIHKQLLQQNAL